MRKRRAPGSCSSPGAGKGALARASCSRGWQGQRFGVRSTRQGNRLPPRDTSVAAGEGRSCPHPCACASPGAVGLQGVERGGCAGWAHAQGTLCVPKESLCCPALWEELMACDRVTVRRSEGHRWRDPTSLTPRDFGTQLFLGTWCSHLAHAARGNETVTREVPPSALLVTFFFLFLFSFS